MNTREPSGLGEAGGISELQLVEKPHLASAPNAAPPSPGVSPAAVRVPGEPTVPHPQGAGLTAWVSQWAQEAFAPTSMGAAPAVAPSPSASPSTQTAPELPQPAPQAMPAEANNPFFIPLRWEGLEENAGEGALPHSYPLLAPPASAAPGGGLPGVRQQFPILQERVNGRPLVWLDNAATTQKPEAVLARLDRFYRRENSNVHRGAHTLAARATDAYESARESVRRFIHAPSKSNIVFVRGTTEGINLVAQSWGRRHVGPGDELVISHLEHHANIVPWQMLAAEKGAKLRVAPVDDQGQIILEEYEKLLGPRTRLVSFTQVSNALGTVTPAQEMIELAHRHGAKVLLDGAQGISHLAVDVQALDCDFYVFSGHKVFAPTGIGALYGKTEVLEAMPPWQGGGNMIQDVTFERTVFQPPAARFEAGTGNIADAVGLGAALDWLGELGVENVARYEHELLEYALQHLVTVPGLHLVGNPAHRAGVISFILEGQKTEEVGGLLDQEGVAVRSGHHCAQPILRRFGLEASVRASLAPYNLREDIDALVAALRRIQSR